MAPTQVSDADLAFWQQCQTRIAGYLTTNGMIEISLCGAFATTIAVLAALGQQLGNSIVFSHIIPAFSLVVLFLAASVYSWIRLQLTYLAVASVHPERLLRHLSYEEWKEAIAERWTSRTRGQRVVITLREAARLFWLLPVHLNNIYCYYFLLYISAAVASMGYAAANGADKRYVILVTGLSWAFLSIGTHDTAKVATVGREVREYMLRDDTHTISSASTTSHRGDTKPVSISEDLEASIDGLGSPSNDVVDLIRSARIHARPFINGRFVEPKTTKTFENVSPINGKVINTIPSCGKEDVDEAVKAAKTSFESGLWSRMPPVDRKLRLQRFAELVEKNADELAVLEAIDVGKPFSLARAVDLNSTLRTMRWYAESIDKVYGEVAPTPTTDIIIREPIGVVAAVVPWNYPLMIAAWKFAPILAAGNSLVLKPAEESPLSALRVAELAAEADIPSGVFNVVPGLGPTAGQALGLHPDVGGIAFTGSTDVGKRFLAYASQSTMKAVSLECGGKSPCIIAADADVGEAVAKTASGVFYNAGQSCNAPTRLIVHESVADEVVGALVREAEAYYPAHPLQKGTKVGSIINPTQLERIEHYVELGRRAGATVALGGARCCKESGGYYYEPTVFTNATTDMEISQDEIFGPVLPVQTYKTIEDAIAAANATRYGLWANVWTNDLSAAHRFARDLQAGTVAINNVFGGDITTPLGGYKESGTGRDRSLHALYKYTQLKHINFNVG